MTFSLGNIVEIIGQDTYGNRCSLGARFKITKLSIAQSGEFRDALLMGGVDTMWYPESSLRLVADELKVGDWVEVIGPVHHGQGPHVNGKIFRISGAISKGSCRIFSAPCIPWYPPTSLRKLSPEEVAKHLAPKDEMITRMASTVERCCERLSAIEKRQDAQQNDMGAIDKRQDNYGNRLADVEHKLSRITKAFQRVV